MYAEEIRLSPAFELLDFLLTTIHSTSAAKSIQDNISIYPFRFDVNIADDKLLAANISLLTSAFLILAREITSPRMNLEGILVPEVQLDEYSRCDISIVEIPDYIEIPTHLTSPDEAGYVPRTSWLEFEELLRELEQAIKAKKNGGRLSVELVELKTQLSPRRKLPHRGRTAHVRQMTRAARSLHRRYGELPDWYRGSRLIYFSPRGVRTFFYSKAFFELQLLNQAR